ncbi:MAG: phosphatidate cytidylyltransferase [Solirubrobacteraceae bacterium]|nr:phosphatidate cytidylyltransferase [Solirubrobacteraceae bacterium]
MAQPRGRARRAQRANTRSDLSARILVALPAIAYAIFIVIEGGVVFTLGLIPLGIVCLHELYEMFDRAHPAKLAGMLGFVGMMFAAHFGGGYDLMLAMAATIPLTFAVTVVQGRGGAPGISVTLLGIVWIAFALAHAVLLRDLPHGNGIVVDVLVGTFLGDTGAYLGGRAFGATPMAPQISPKKTWEGLGVGLVVAVAAVWFAGLYQDWLNGTDALILGIVVALGAPIGDLFESYLKRDAGTKDTGRLFGAHGGALDRLDAVLFTAVIGYYVWSGLS